MRSHQAARCPKWTGPTASATRGLWSLVLSKFFRCLPLPSPNKMRVLFAPPDPVDDDLALLPHRDEGLGQTLQRARTVPYGRSDKNRLQWVSVGRTAANLDRANAPGEIDKGVEPDGRTFVCPPLG